MDARHKAGHDVERAESRTLTEFPAIAALHMADPQPYALKCRARGAILFSESILVRTRILKAFLPR